MVFSNAAFLQSAAALSPPYASGSLVDVNVSGLVAGTYSLWVVGRNRSARSSESNRVDITWNPEVEAGVAIIRHHDNVIGDDPGDPTGAQGTGGGWYDPTVGTMITTNVPADPAPHWEATTTALIEEGTNRIVDFEISGTSGAQTFTGGTSEACLLYTSPSPRDS